MSPEFALIEKYFTRPARNATLGVGDDCALIGVAAGYELAISTDTMVSGTHFFAEADPQKLGHKALAVNLSDLAAMGAKPRYVALALTLPQIDDNWLAAFARGFFSLADEHRVELIGGDTTRGPLSITITALGEVGVGAALRRDTAKDGDDIWVSGDLGGAALALRHLQGTVALPAEIFERAAERLHTPTPRIALGRALLGIASSAIDISDGLVADMAHICERSKLSARIDWAMVPLHPALQTVGRELQIACALTGGDDYELCFTAPEIMRREMPRIAAETGLAISRIGTMHPGDPKVHVHDDHGAKINFSSGGFDHFLSQSK